MAVTWIDVVDTSVKIGLGVVVGGGVTMLLEYLRRREEHRRASDELRHKYFIDPVVTFMDDVLAAIGEVYWAHVDGRAARMSEKMAFYQERHGSMEARVLALGDRELAELWHPFTRKIAEVRIRLGSRDVGDPYEKMEEAFDLGGKILRRLFHLQK